MTDYISVSENIEGFSITQQWKYLPAPAAAAAGGGGSSTAADPRDVIAQYYALEGQHCPTKTAARLNFKHFETALPRHYAIVAASRQPRQFSSLTDLQTSSLRASAATSHSSNSRARVRAHTLSDITPFTELTVRQKGVVIAHSALAHLVVKKLAGVFRAKPHERRVALEHADIIASFISSALACEYLVGNRYYRNLPTILASEIYIVGSGENTRTYCAQLTLADVTPAKIQENEEAFQVIYDANIDRLESCVEQYERGFVSLKTLRTDPEFVKMFAKFLELNFQTIKWRSLSQDRITAAAAAAHMSWLRGGEYPSIFGQMYDKSRPTSGRGYYPNVAGTTSAYVCANQSIYIDKPLGAENPNCIKQVTVGPIGSIGFAPWPWLGFFAIYEGNLNLGVSVKPIKNVPWTISLQAVQPFSGVNKFDDYYIRDYPCAGQDLNTCRTRVGLFTDFSF